MLLVGIHAEGSVMLLFLSILAVVFLVGACVGRAQMTRDWRKWETELTRPEAEHWRRSL